MKPLPKSNIETFDYSFGAAIGCTRGCSYCYARKMAMAFAKNLGREPDQPFSEITVHPDKIDRLDVSPNGKSYFVAPLSDLYCDGFPWKERLKILIAIYDNPQKTFYLQTKFPQNIEASGSVISHNCIVGVSVTNRADLVRANILASKFQHTDIGFYVSFEPLLEQVFAEPIERTLNNRVDFSRALSSGRFRWFIVGPQTNTPGHPNRIKQPSREAVLQIRELAKRYNIPLWEKIKLDVGLPRIQERPA